MGNEKYLNYYIETLTATLTDCVVRNVSLQANAKVTEDVISELTKELDQKNNFDNDKIDSLNKQVVSLREENIKLKNENNELKNIRNEYESIKNQVNHVNTFRNELLKSRKETEDVRSEFQKTISELNAKIEYLQLPPSKKKKIDMLNKSEESLIEVFTSDESTKDGGSF